MPTTTVDVTDLGFDVEPGADRTATINVKRDGPVAEVTIERGAAEYELTIESGRVTEQVPAPPVTLPQWVPPALEDAGVELEVPSA